MGSHTILLRLRRQRTCDTIILLLVMTILLHLTSMILHMMHHLSSLHRRLHLVIRLHRATTDLRMIIRLHRTTSHQQHTAAETLMVEATAATVASLTTEATVIAAMAL